MPAAGRLRLVGRIPGMGAQILDGASLAAQIRRQVAADVAELTAGGHAPMLAAVLVGDSEACLLYANSQHRHCQKVGISYQLHHLPAGTDQASLAAVIDRLNADPAVTGIVLLLPLPEGMAAHEMQYRIDPYKDAEGVNPANIGLVFYGSPIIAPCTALAVMELVRLTQRPLEGALAVVVGQGAIVGKPVTMFLLQQNATVVGCHKHTRNLPEHTRRADLLIVAAGQPQLVGPEMVKPGAVVIDVGINRLSVTGPDGQPASKVVGDVRFDEVAEVAGAITPVPGGVGPVTVAILLRNTVEAVRKQLARTSS